MNYTLALWIEYLRWNVKRRLGRALVILLPRRRLCLRMNTHILEVKGTSKIPLYLMALIFANRKRLESFRSVVDVRVELLSQRQASQGVQGVEVSFFPPGLYINPIYVYTDFAGSVYPPVGYSRSQGFRQHPGPCRCIS